MILLPTAKGTEKFGKVHEISSVVTCGQEAPCSLHLFKGTPGQSVKITFIPSFLPHCS